MSKITNPETYDIINKITLPKYKFYHKPEYTKCDMNDPYCSCIKPIIIKHPLKDISPEHPDYYIIVLISVKHNGNSLSCASKEMRDNEEIVKAAVEQAGGALQYASPRLQKIKKIVCIAVAQWSKAIKYIPEELQDDSDIQKLRKLSSTTYLKIDEDIIYAMLNTNGYAYYKISPSLKIYTITEFIQKQIDRYIRINIVLLKKINNNIINIVIDFYWGFAHNKLIKILTEMKLFHQ